MTPSLRSAFAHSPAFGLRLLARKLGFALAVFVIVSPAILVFLWMLSLSLKNEIENTSYPPVLIPTEWAWRNYVAVFEQNPFLLYTWNSIVVSGVSTAVALLLGVPAGYGLAKARASGIAVLILISRMTPGLSYLIPLFILFRLIGLTGTLYPVIIIHLVITLPIVVWIMMSFYESLPRELEEAALTDGASLWQAFQKVALPLSRPGITVAAILAFIFSWNNFIFGVVLAGRETRTLPVAVYNALSFEQVAWGPLAAAALIVTLPVLILTAFVQREIVGGLSAGAVKGG
jgi:multiple sugar transport system permease protein